MRGPGAVPSPAVSLRLASALLAAALVAAGAGCGAGPRTGTLPPDPALGPASASSSPAETPAVTPSPSATYTLGQPDDGSPASAARFAVAYVEETGRAVATGDTSRLQTLAAPGCACQRTAAFVQKAYRDGHLMGGNVVVRQPPDDVRVQKGVGQVDLHYTGATVRWQHADGQVTEVEKGAEYHVEVVLRRASSHWVTYDVVRLGA